MKDYKKDKKIAYIYLTHTKYVLENTGSRQIGEWYDLGNMRKVLADDEDNNFWLAGGDYYVSGYFYPLANFAYVGNKNDGNGFGWIVTGWIVLSV